MIFIDENVCRLNFEEELNIYKIEQLKNDILDTFDSIEKFEVDLANVKEFDSAGFQFLVSTKKLAQENNKEFVITNMSKTVQELLELYNVKSYFE